jgi:hypothetical protein
MKHYEQVMMMMMMMILILIVNEDEDENEGDQLDSTGCSLADTPTCSYPLSYCISCHLN